MKRKHKYTKYMHHGATVSVRADLKGTHREHCLCYAPCAMFHPESRTKNCKIANALFDLCVQFNLATPVFECSAFLEGKEEKQKD